MLTGLPETSRGETGIGGKTLMTYRVKVVELFWPMHNSHIHSTTVGAYNYSNDYAYVLTIMPFNQPMKSMVSGLNIHTSNSYTIVLKPNK